MSEGLVLYDSMRATKVPFKPINRGSARMFVCGPTVQGLMHMGHARTYVFYDVLAKYLSHIGYKVRFVVNITDVDERITMAARDEGVTPMTLARRFERYFREDMRRLRIDTITSFERVSDYAQVAIGQISELISKNHAYAVAGWVYFDISTFPDFGKLSHQSPRELSLHPLELSVKKRNLLDFSLWRPEILLKGKWKSPWGMGSPGWHIQDTAITITTLGETYDIHGGAYELIYPHHEAEIAQGESLTGKSPMVHYWVHTHLVNQEGEKMSKSAGNVYTVRNALKKFSPDQIRFFLLSRHYREDMGLEGLERMARTFQKLSSKAKEIPRGTSSIPKVRLDVFLAPFKDAMNDDLDSPRAIRWLENVISAGARATGAEASLILAAVRTASQVLGLDLLGEAQ